MEFVKSIGIRKIVVMLVRGRGTKILYTLMLIFVVSYVKYLWTLTAMEDSTKQFSIAQTNIILGDIARNSFDKEVSNAVFGANKTTPPSWEEYVTTDTGANSSELLCKQIDFRQVNSSNAPSLREYRCRLLSVCEAESRWRRNANVTNLCPCLPKNLVGVSLQDMEVLQEASWRTLARGLPGVQPGGYWAPADCISRRRVAVIIPYRDRERHLRTFLGHTHPILQRQLIEYRIFVIEQNLPFTFNKASLMNIGFVEAVKQFDPDCVLFHDVDTLIERDDNMVICEETPVHFAAYSDRFQYKFKRSLFGSAILLRAKAFQSINGFSNLFYGWGGEDDDIKNRILERKIDIYRAPLEIGRCTILNHTRDVLFTKGNYKITLKLYKHMQRHKTWHRIDGLNSLRYQVVEQKHFPLYTWILVDLQRPTANKLPITVARIVSYIADRVYNATFPKFSTTMERCLTRSENPNRHFASRITCRFLCITTPGCRMMQYVSKPRDQRDSYCILHANCSTVHSSRSVELHTKLERQDSDS